MDLLVNIDVPDLERAVPFYRDAFGLTVTRHLGKDAVELTGWPARAFLLRKPPGSPAAAQELRHYNRHWTPVHLDMVVDDLDTSLARALAAGAQVESQIRVETWGKFVVIADPFGNGMCLLQFLGRGYDEISVAADECADEPACGNTMPRAGSPKSA